MDRDAQDRDRRRRLFGRRDAAEPSEAEQQVSEANLDEEFAAAVFRDRAARTAAGEAPAERSPRDIWAEASGADETQVLRHERDSALSQLAHSEQQRRTLQAQLAELAAEGESTRQAARDHFETMAAELAAARGQAGDGWAALEQARADGATLRDQVAALQGELEATQAQLAKAEVDLVNAQADVEIVRADVEQEQAARARAEQEADALRDQVAAADAAAEQVRAELADAKNELDSTRSELAQMQTSLHALLGDVEQARDDLNRTGEKLLAVGRHAAPQVDDEPPTGADVTGEIAMSPPPADLLNGHGARREERDPLDIGDPPAAYLLDAELAERDS